MDDNKLIDLHVHTTYSDGDKTPDEILNLAQEKKIGVIAITDHDNINGLKNIKQQHKNIKLINGVEFSAKVEKGSMHILGYGIDIENKSLNDKVIELKSNRINKILFLLGQLEKDYSIKFSQEEIDEIISKNNVGRPDVAKLCVKHHHAESVQEAFDKYLIDAYDKIKSKIKQQTYTECINLIINSGGIPVLAHPNTLKLTEKELLILIKKMISIGLKGIECYHSTFTEEESKLYLRIAKDYNLLISGGSDYHGPSVKPNIELGTGKNGNLRIRELSILEKL